MAYLLRLGASPLGGSLSEDSAIYWRWAGVLLQQGAWGSNPFFLGPLYPYVLAGLRVAVGESITAVLVFQALWGAAAAALLADAARRLTGPVLGLMVGVLVAGYEMAVFFDGLVLMESLLFFLEALLIWGVVRERGPHWVRLALAGILIGLLAQGRATSALLLLPAGIFLVPEPGRPAGTALARAAVLLAGFALVALPVAFRNRAVSGEWIPFTYNGGFNLYVGNNPEANGSFVSVTGTQLIGATLAKGEDGGVEADGREYLRRAENLDLTPAASSAYWTRKAWEHARAHPGTTARLAARKLGMMWNRREYPQVENADQFRAVAGPLGLPGVGSFLLVGPLAMAGLWFAWGRGRGARFVVGYALVTTLAIAPFFVTDRYRHHLIPAAVVLAAVAVDAGLAVWRKRDGWGALRWLVALAVGVMVVNLPAPGLSAGKYAWGLAFDLGTRWAEQGRPDLAVIEFEKAVALERSGAVSRAGGSLAAIERANLYFNYGNALGRVGRRGEAPAWYERAVRAAPGHAAALRALADAQAAAGNADRAESLYAALESRAGGPQLARVGRGWLAARAGRLDQAEQLFTLAVGEDSTQWEAWGALIRIQAQTGRTTVARATLERARRAGLPLPALRAHEALMAALSGDSEAARRALAEVPETAIRDDATLADVVRVVQGMLARSP